MHRPSVSEALKFFDVKSDKGLSDAQVQANREKYGSNKLDEQEKKSVRVKLGGTGNLHKRVGSNISSSVLS